MNAVFNFKVSINEGKVLVNIDVEKTKDVDINFLQQTLKVLNDASKKIKFNAEKYNPGAVDENQTTEATNEETAVPAEEKPEEAPEPEPSYAASEEGEQTQRHQENTEQE